MGVSIYLFIYLFLINLFSFILMGIDKRRAKKMKWRVRERHLFLIAFLGGAFGIFAGMKTFHHKTKHASFRYGIPAIIVLHAAIIISVFITRFD